MTGKGKGTKERCKLQLLILNRLLIVLFILHNIFVNSVTTVANILTSIVNTNYTVDAKNPA